MNKEIKIEKMIKEEKEKVKSKINISITKKRNYINAKNHINFIL